MRSLRSRLGLVVSLGALATTAIAATAIAYERWQEENETLPRAVELTTFQLAELPDPIGADATVALDAIGGRDAFTIAFDDAGDRIGGIGALGEELRDDLLEDIWTITTDDDVVATAEYDVDGAVVSAAGVVCLEPDACDTIVVGARRQGFGGYAADRLPWLTLPPVLVAVAAGLAARWLVGRSLRPVEAMRRELDAITSSELDRRVPVPVTGDELEHLGVTMNATIDRLGDAVAANERFVADAAHELRSPITGVRAALEVEAGRAGSELLADAVGELDRAGRLVDDLLLLARRQAGTGEPAEDVDLDDIVRSVVSSARARHEGVEVRHELVPVRVRGASDAFTRVVTNLVDNACRYGDGTVSVELSMVEDSSCRLVVDDDGEGIPAADRERIFERFARLDASRARASGGSGLGLAIVAELVGDHGGRIAVENAPLGGARFVVELPT